MTLRPGTRATIVSAALTVLLTGGALAARAASVPTSPAISSSAAVPQTDGRTCADDSLLFCEDFDRLPSGGASSLRWGIDTRNATMTVAPVGGGSGTRRHGSQGLHLHTVDNGRAFLTVTDLELQGKPLYGRMRLRVQAFPTAPDWAHFTLVEATGTGSPEIVRPVGGQYAPSHGKTMWGVGADGGPTGDWTEWRESAPTTADTWQCVEWRLDPQDNQVQTWFDGVDNPELRADTNAHGGNQVPFVLPAVTTVKIGWQLYQSGTAPKTFDLWIDDVALGTDRIGC